MQVKHNSGEILVRISTNEQMVFSDPSVRVGEEYVISIDQDGLFFLINRDNDLIPLTREAKKIREKNLKKFLDFERRLKHAHHLIVLIDAYNYSV